MVTLAVVAAVVGVVLLIAFGARTLLREVTHEPEPVDMKRTTLTITTQNGTEALALKTALDDPQTRAFLLVVGSLLLLVGGNTPLGPRAREQALRYVAERETRTKD